MLVFVSLKMELEVFFWYVVCSDLIVCISKNRNKIMKEKRREKRKRKKERKEMMMLMISL
jgi:hypothetical protein